MSYGALTTCKRCGFAVSEPHDCPADWPTEQEVRSRLREAEELLREVEWWWRPGPTERSCLFCIGLEGEGHRADCRLAAFLAGAPSHPAPGTGGRR